MTNAILLVSRGQLFESSHAFVLREAGYRVLVASDLGEAMQLARSCRMAVIGNTFSAEEQEEFTDGVHESHPDVHVVCLRAKLERPTVLLNQIVKILNGQPPDSRAHIMHLDGLTAEEGSGKTEAEETARSDHPSNLE